MKTLKKVWLKCIQLLTLIALTQQVSAQLKADFAANPQVGCPPMVVNFKDKSLGNPTEWKWDLGNGTVSFLQSPIATYFNPGNYTIKLVVKNTQGTDSIARTQYIIVQATPLANFAASDTTGCFPLKVQFKDSSIAGSGTIASWQWDFGDGNLSSAQNPEHTYVNAGVFTVTLRVVNSNGCVKVFTRPAYIKLSNGVKSNFSFIVNPGCQSPTPVQFTNKTEGTGSITYHWDFGNGQTSQAVDPTTNYAAVGAYSIKLVATNSSGCSDTLVKKDIVNIAFVKANFSKVDSVCVNKPLTLTNTSTPAPVSAVWYFSDGTSSEAISTTKFFTTPGKYTVKLISNFGNCVDSITKPITVMAGPAVSFNAIDLSGCKLPHTAKFTNTSVNGVSYLWRFGDGATSTQQSPAHTYSRYGTYAVTLVVTNKNGCQDSIVKTDLVKVVAPKITSFTRLPVRGCVPYSITPIANIASNENITSYFWNFGDGTTSTDEKPSKTYTIPGAYTVSLVVRTASGCSDSIVVRDAVKVGTLPGSAFTADPLDVCAETRVTFIDQTKGAFVHEWFWTFGDGGTSDLQNPFHQFTDTGRFDITLITSNFGCSDTLKKVQYVQVTPPISRFDTAFLCSEPMKRNFIDKSLGATSWEWDFGDGNTSRVASPSHIYASADNYKVVLKVSNGKCEHTSTRMVRVINDKPIMQTTDSIACRNARVTYTVTNVIAANIKNYTWYPLGPGTTPTVSPIYGYAQYYKEPGIQNPYVIVTNVLGCQDSVTTNKPIVIYGPTAGFAAPVTATCFSNPIAFTDTSRTDGIHTIKEWIWTYGDGKSEKLTAPPFGHQYDSAGIFGVNMTVVDSYGCRDSVSKPNLLTISRPIAKFILSDTLVCPKVPVVFSSQSTGTNLEYTWNFGDGTTSTVANPTRAYQNEGMFTVSMSIKDRFGCTSTSDTIINIVQTKGAFLMSDSFSSCPPLLVDFTNQSKGYTVLSYDFGDGGISTLNDPAHIYTYPGIYTVKLTVRNNGGCTDIVTRKVAIQGPTGVFKYDPLVACNPTKVDFVATTKNAVSYVWDYNDGTTIISGATTTSHTYTQPGIYLPKIILQDESGCKVPLTGKDTIQVKFIESHILTSRRVLCDSGFVQFNDSTISNDLIKSFAWDFGDGKKAVGINPKHNYTNPGWHTIKMTATTATGCSSNATLLNYVKVVNSPSITILGDTSACLPGGLTFSGGLLRPDTSTLSWKWNLGNGVTSTLQGPPAQTYTAPGTYPISMVVTNADGCKDSTVRFAEIRPIPVVRAGADTVICRNNAVTLNATGATTYTWNASSSLSCFNCAAPVANPIAKNQYFVTGKSAFGCVGRDTVQVDVVQPFKMTVNGGDTVCVGANLKLTATGADRYQWSPAQWLTNPSSNNPVARPDSSITYKVVGYSQNNCFTDTGSVRIKVYPIPQIDILGSEVMVINVGSSVQLQTKNSPDITQWRWLPGQFLSCTNCPDPRLTPRESGTYSVVGSNEGNCVARDQVTINLVCNNSNVFIPNTFSPNNDGSNDRFYPRGTGVFSIKGFRIYNRWGQLVFQNTNLSANDAAAGWDGKLNGKELSPDVYIYVMDLVCENSAIYPVRGNITLIR